VTQGKIQIKKYVAELHRHSNSGATLPAGSDMQAFIIETMLTFIPMFVIINGSTAAKETGITVSGGSKWQDVARITMTTSVEPKLK
jgi:hypothetical protein